MQSVYLIIMAGLISLLTHVVQTEAQGIPTIFAKVGQPGTEEMVSIPSGEFTMGSAVCQSFSSPSILVPTGATGPSSIVTTVSDWP
jgi:formylglycine-generating enzyme required for sulfatase activity